MTLSFRTYATRTARFAAITFIFLFVISMFTGCATRSRTDLDISGPVTFRFSPSSPGDVDGWDQVLPSGHRAYTNYIPESDDEGGFLAISSAGTGSWIERDIGEINPGDLPTLEWTWKIETLPAIEWERDDGQDDFAVRIELVFDFAGGILNPRKLLYKDPVRGLVGATEPELILSYVWAASVPAGEPYVSESAGNTVIIPVESGYFQRGTWLTERRDILGDLNEFSRHKSLVLKKIRIRSDTDTSATTAEAGIRSIRLLPPGG